MRQDWNGEAYLYDQEGNRTKRTEIATGKVTEYSWDHRNRMTKVVDKNAGGTVTQTVEFAYDAFNRRVAKRLSNDSDAAFEEASYFVYDGQQIALEYFDRDGDGTATPELAHRYLFGPVVDMILADEQLLDSSGLPSPASRLLWPLTDHLGSVRDVVDSSGVVREHVVYNAFGVRTSEQDFNAEGNAITSTDPAAIDLQFGFAGKDWDDDIQQQYNLNRWYDPRLGRWTSQDPIGISAGDPNFYRPVGNHPTYATDPDGLKEPRRGTAGSILRDLAQTNPAMNRTVRERAESFTPGIEAGQAGQRLMADISGAGCVVDATEAYTGNDAFNGNQLSWTARKWAGFWAVFGILSPIDNADDAARATRKTSKVANVAPNRGFTIVDSGVAARKVRLVPNNPLDTAGNWGLRFGHVNKHFFGNSKFSLSKIDPGGTPDCWMGHISRLFSRPETSRTAKGIIDIIGEFPRTDGSGMFKLGVRLSPNADGTFDLITILTKQ